MTLVPLAQYSCGRKSRRVLENQCPTISTPGSATTVMACWTALRSVTGLLKLIETGMPTPTTEPSSGVK